MQTCCNSNRYEQNSYEFNHTTCCPDDWNFDYETHDCNDYNTTKCNRQDNCNNRDYNDNCKRKHKCNCDDDNHNNWDNNWNDNYNKKRCNERNDKCQCRENCNQKNRRCCGFFPFRWF